MTATHLEVKWTVSRGRDTYGYNICSLWKNGKRVSACNGGGYDMKGTSFGNWLAREYADRLIALTPEQMPEQHQYNHETKEREDKGRYFYGLTFQNPDYDPGKAVIGQDCHDRTFSGKAEGKTVEQAEEDCQSAGLERYQAFYSASAKNPSEKHRVPLIDGGCGFREVEKIAAAIGITFEYLRTSGKNRESYILHDARGEG